MLLSVGCLHLFGFVVLVVGVVFVIFFAQQQQQQRQQASSVSAGIVMIQGRQTGLRHDNR